MEDFELRLESDSEDDLDGDNITDKGNKISKSFTIKLRKW